MVSIRIGYNKIDKKQQAKILETIEKRHLLPNHITASKAFFEERYTIDGLTFAVVYEPRSSFPCVFLYV